MTRVFVEEEASLSALEGKSRGWDDENQGMRQAGVVMDLFTEQPR